MNHTEKDLFQIGEVSKLLGVTRRMIINYESLGLLTPAYKNESSGFRYYNVDNIVHIRIIRTLQNLGLSLPEIKNYFDNTVALEKVIDRMVLLRTHLDQFIAQLQLRQTQTSEPEFHRVTLPAFTAFCREFHGLDLTAKTKELRQAYIDTAKNHKIDLHNKMCIQIPINSEHNGMYIIPVTSDSKGENIRVFHQTTAICVYYRGAYENFPTVHAKLLEYAKQNNMTPSGYFRNIYMEGPPTHDANKDAYITQIAMPIKFADSDKD